MNFFMKTTYRLFYVMCLLLAFLVMGCSEENDPGNDQGDDTEEPGGDNGPDTGPKEPMYFPPNESDDWESISAQELGWDTVSFNDARRGTYVVDAAESDAEVQKLVSVGTKQARRGRPRKSQG